MSNIEGRKMKEGMVYFAILLSQNIAGFLPCHSWTMKRIVQVFRTHDTVAPPLSLPELIGQP